MSIIGNGQVLEEFWHILLTVYLMMVIFLLVNTFSKSDFWVPLWLWCANLLKITHAFYWIFFRKLWDYFSFHLAILYLHFTFFLGEPNDLNSEDCAIVQSTNLYLIDISCSTKSVIICEKKTYKENSWNTIIKNSLLISEKKSISEQIRIDTKQKV